jgi:AbrB family looped-hinge helix DNA binding protein
MKTAKLSTKGQLVIPTHFRKALHLRAGDRVRLRLAGEKLIIERDSSTRARLLEKRGRKLLVAPPGAPPMDVETVKVMLADFP